MELNEEQEKALKQILNDKVQSNKQKEENKAVNDGKEIEWYAALVNANFTTRFELDRQLLTIASAAIGVLVTFMSDINSLLMSGLWFFAGVCFLATIMFSLNIFKNNRYLIECILNNQETSFLDNSLRNKDIMMKWCFIVGIITLFIVAILKLNILN